MTSACPADRALCDFVAGQLAPVESSSVLEHINSCPRCAALVQVMETGSPPTEFILGDLRGTEAPDAPVDPEFFAAVERLIAEPPLAPGPSVGDSIDDYRLVEMLGEGGMGVVFRAVHTRLGKDVALKVIRRNRALDPQAADRFRREMLAAGKARHPNLVQATDAGATDGMQYLVMEYLPGTNLGRLVQRDGPLPVGRACELVRQAALGLHHAHEHGLVHRDVKPSNLLLGDDGVVRVLDLGLALLPDDVAPPGAAHPAAPADAATALADDTLTTPGQQLGTRDYAAPEQIADSHRVDRRADVYGLGCTLAYLLTGKPYSDGALPPQLPAELWVKFLAAHPDQRFPTARAAAEALAALSTTPAPAERSERPRRGWVLPAALVAAVAAGAAGAILLLNNPPPKESPDPNGRAHQPEPAAPEQAPAPREVPPRGRLPMTPEQALALQKQWAEHLGQPVSVTNTLGMELVLIPPAEFNMSVGYSVTLTRPYRVGALEVTRGQFEKFLAANPRYKTAAETKPGTGVLVAFPKLAVVAKTKPPYHLRNPGWGPYADDQPVTYVSWADAEAFLNWLSHAEGRKYRLPTYAEWTWASRAGSSMRFYWGSTAEEMGKFAWTRLANRSFPQPVGKLIPNQWGLYDAIGNVSEMVLDYHAVPAPTGHATDPAGPPAGPERIACGGNYAGQDFYSLDRLPSSAVVTNFAGSTLGFRVVLEP